MENAAALVCGHARLSFQDVADRFRRLGGLLDAYQVQSGDRVGVLGSNSVALFDLYLGVPGHGRVIVPLNTRWADVEVKYALRDAGIKLLFIDREPGVLAQEVEHVVRTDLIDDYEVRLWASVGSRSHEVQEDDLAGVFYTGGTTGEAKGVMLTNGNLNANADAMAQIAPLDSDDVFLIMAPMFHAAGTTSIIYALSAGARQVIVPFDPGDVLDAIEAEGVTHTLAVPTMLNAIIEEQSAHPRDVSSLRVLMHGASPITPALVARAQATFPDAELVHLYGTTETSPIVAALRHETPDISRTVGEPVGCVVRLADDGEVCVQGPNVMKGYWGKPTETEAVLIDGWYYTGDIGTFDAVGRLCILDRKNDLIITGGENVYPSEVEAVLAGHPAVLEAAVYGVPSEEWGEVVWAAVVTREEVPTYELLDYARERLASFKVPRVVTFMDSLPKSPAGKVLRRALR